MDEGKPTKDNQNEGNNSLPSQLLLRKLIKGY